MIVRLLALFALVGAAGLALAKEEPSLQRLLQDDAVADGWIYEDLASGFEQAERSGKPLLVCFSCVP